ncbi:uncharacterized protein [Blastocystis hominis]|uniref:Transcription factor TFIIIB component B'' Myb domain-containing protein n=1 Tax=Blastocystis hominis TaxID=12968 RepID=D8M6C2_BLAHO|nr:uncharacterized protein [Blastocystis hominis]CBK23675.2 unnamed protein product [Blastocystis hominis]|eukprot:XP_012897723.1 uncharacterized protein [Blastocystis hominis]
MRKGDRWSNTISVSAKQWVCEYKRKRHKIGKMYKNTEPTVSQENIKSLGDFIRFTNEGIPTRAEQLKRDRKLYETGNLPQAASSSSGATLQGEVVGTIESHRSSPKQRKGISVSFSNGQIVLDRSSINRQVDQFDGNDSDDEQELADLINKPYRQRKHKLVSWSVEETRQFYECLRRFGTDFFLMNQVITNRTRNDVSHSCRIRSNLAKKQVQNRGKAKSALGQPHFGRSFEGEN